MYNKPLWYRIKEFLNERPKQKERKRLMNLLETETDEKKIEAIKFSLELINNIWMSDYKLWKP